jgi:hypothetical protein
MNQRGVPVMPKRTVFLMTLTLLLTFAPSLIQAAVPVTPRLVVPETIDVGQVQQGGTVERNLILENTGGEVMTIKSITTDCPCTSLYMKKGDQGQAIDPQTKLTIYPKSQIEIKIIFDSNKTKYVGAVKKFIVIESDDQERPVVRIRLTGEIVKS